MKDIGIYVAMKNIGLVRVKTILSREYERLNRFSHVMLALLKTHQVSTATHPTNE
jgi:hypothetical protein